MCFDEASILAQKASEGAYSVSKPYQEAVDVFKKYIGNERNLVVGISTNLLSESFEDALTREGRLTSYFIGYPSSEQKKRMWKYFTNQYGIMGLSERQAEILAELVPSEQGAFIEEFCRNYNRTRRSAILREKGYGNLVEALKGGANIPDDDVKSTIAFDIVHSDLIAALEEKYKRTEESKPRENGRKIMGFGPSN